MAIRAEARVSHGNATISLADSGGDGGAGRGDLVGLAPATGCATPVHASLLYSERTNFRRALGGGDCRKTGGVLAFHIAGATSVRLYLWNRRTASLESVPTTADPEPMAVSLAGEAEGLSAGAVKCFNERALVNIPDVRRNALVNAGWKSGVARSAMFAPLLAQTETLGVVEVGSLRRLGYFTAEEQATLQHLAKQVAASLKLEEQQSMREQLFRSEKLAATGQLISGVANDLRAPLARIRELAASLPSGRRQRANRARVEAARRGSSARSGNRFPPGIVRAAGAQQARVRSM